MSNDEENYVFSVDKQQLQIFYRLLKGDSINSAEKRELIFLTQEVKQYLDN